MPNMSAQALRTAVVNAAISDATFLKELGKDAAKAIETRFGAQTVKPQVHFEKENELTFLIPQKTEKLEQAIQRAVTEIGDRSPTRGEFDTLVISRAWTDPAFLGELRRDTRTAIASALQKYGASVPEGSAVRLYEEQPGECVIVVPRPVDVGAQLSDAELEAVAGGELAATAAIIVVGAVATVIADKIISVDAV